MRDHGRRQGAKWPAVPVDGRGGWGYVTKQLASSFQRHMDLHKHILLCVCRLQTHCLTQSPGLSCDELEWAQTRGRNLNCWDTPPVQTYTLTSGDFGIWPVPCPPPMLNIQHDSLVILFHHSLTHHFFPPFFFFCCWNLMVNLLIKKFQMSDSFQCNFIKWRCVCSVQYVDYSVFNAVTPIHSRLEIPTSWQSFLVTG